MTTYTLEIEGYQPIVGDMEIEAPAPVSSRYRLMKWGDPIVKAEAGLSVEIAGTTNFQAMGLYNKLTGFGGVSNYLEIPHSHVMKLAALQIEDDYKDKQLGWNQQYNMAAWRVQKMNWLAKERGTIYFWHHDFSSGHWSNLSHLEWGTIGIGHNYVTVEDTEFLTVRTPDGITRKREMARLQGFTPADWDRPLPELLSLGLVHRAYCAYSGDDIGDSPKGIVYTPFWSPRHFTFIGSNRPQPDAFYLPLDWMYKD
jgi:hypothetical protein